MSSVKISRHPGGYRDRPGMPNGGRM